MAFGSGNNSTTSRSHNSSSTSQQQQQQQSGPQQQQKCSSTAQSSSSVVALGPNRYYEGVVSGGGGSASSSADTFQQHPLYFDHRFSKSGKITHHPHHHHQQQQRFAFSGRGDEGSSSDKYFGGGGGGSGEVGGRGGLQYNHQQGFGGGGGVVGQQGQVPGGNSKDLNDSERALLESIRARKAELLSEIAQLQDEIDSVSRELLYTQKDDPPPPDLISTQRPTSINHGYSEPTDVPLADGELDNLSEHSEETHGQQAPTKIPTSTVLGSNSSSSSNSSKEKDRLKIMSLGCKKFNMDPKKGIEFLVENGLLKKDDEQELAIFLYRGEGLNKTAIGDYLGERSPLNERVLKSFVGLHDFTDLILVQALRQFLWSFRLPGEAQKIDRMMECFAQRYCQNNPDIFTNTDTCYVLSFAIIMLNTSLHNPSVKDKPTIDTFVSMNRGINNGGDLPRELLISLYNSIQSEPFKIPEDDGNDLMHTFFNPDKEGWLWKQGGRYKTWKRRWFILNDNCLYYFEFTTDKEPRGIIPLENVGVREIEESNSKSRQRYCFELYATDGSEVIKACKTDSDGRVVEGKHSVYRMSAANGEERDSWVKALRQSISYSPFYEILRKSGGPTGGGGGGQTSTVSLSNTRRIRE